MRNYDRDFMSAPAFHRLGGGDTGLRVEQTLLTVLVDVFKRQVALGLHLFPF